MGRAWDRLRGREPPDRDVPEDGCRGQSHQGDPLCEVDGETQLERVGWIHRKDQVIRRDQREPEQKAGDEARQQVGWQASAADPAKEEMGRQTEYQRSRITKQEYPARKLDAMEDKDVLVGQNQNAEGPSVEARRKQEAPPFPPAQQSSLHRAKTKYSATAGQGQS